MTYSDTGFWQGFQFPVWFPFMLWVWNPPRHSNVFNVPGTHPIGQVCVLSCRTDNWIRKTVFIEPCIAPSSHMLQARQERENSHLLPPFFLYILTKVCSVFSHKALVCLRWALRASAIDFMVSGASEPLWAATYKVVSPYLVWGHISSWLLKAALPPSSYLFAVETLVEFRAPASG